MDILTVDITVPIMEWDMADIMIHGAPGVMVEDITVDITVVPIGLDTTMDTTMATTMATMETTIMVLQITAMAEWITDTLTDIQGQAM